MNEHTKDFRQPLRMWDRPGGTAVESPCFPA